MDNNLPKIVKFAIFRRFLPFLVEYSPESVYSITMKLSAFHEVVPAINIFNFEAHSVTRIPQLKNRHFCANFQWDIPYKYSIAMRISEKLSHLKNILTQSYLHLFATLKHYPSLNFEKKFWTARPNIYIYIFGVIKIWNIHSQFFVCEYPFNWK